MQTRIFISGVWGRHVIPVITPTGGNCGSLIIMTRQILNWTVPMRDWNAKLVTHSRLKKKLVCRNDAMNVIRERIFIVGDLVAGANVVM
jgi:hypothetical protein